MPSYHHEDLSSSSRRRFSRKQCSPYQDAYEEHRTNTQETTEKRCNSTDRHQSDSFFPSKSLIDIAREGVSQLSCNEAQVALKFLMDSLPEITTVKQMFLLKQNLSLSEKNLRNSPFFKKCMDDLKAQNSDYSNKDYYEEFGAEGLLNMLKTSAPYVPRASIISSQQPGSTNSYQGVPYPGQAQTVGSAMNVPRLDGNASYSVATFPQMAAQAPYQPSTSYAFPQ